MKFYLVDDDIAIIKVLENIIEDNNLGEVLGYSLNGEDGVRDIMLKNPDVVLVDLLMPGKDGIHVVKEIIKNSLNIKFIMISQVSSKDMIGKAYDLGIEYFINKPINEIEVTKVIEKVTEKITMEKTLNNIKNMFILEKTKVVKNCDNNRIKNIKTLLSKLGVLGESGGQDILKICDYLIKNEKRSIDISIKKACNILDDSPRAMEQRIRRTVNKALINIANIGLEDYMNEVFVNYSNSLFDFEDIKREMDYIRGKKIRRGKINVKKFINGLLLESELKL